MKVLHGGLRDKVEKRDAQMSENKRLGKQVEPEYPQKRRYDDVHGGKRMVNQTYTQKKEHEEKTREEKDETWHMQMSEDKILERKDKKRKRKKRKKQKEEDVPGSAMNEGQNIVEVKDVNGSNDEICEDVQELDDITQEMSAEWTWWQSVVNKGSEVKNQEAFSELGQLKMIYETGLFNEDWELLNEWRFVRREFEKKSNKGVGGGGVLNGRLQSEEWNGCREKRFVVGSRC